MSKQYALETLLPSVIPPGWHRLEPPEVLIKVAPKCASFCRVYDNLRLLISVDDYPDGAGIWLHASASHPTKLPRWRDLVTIQRIWLGNRPTVQLLPPEEHWLNLHPYTLYLFSRLDGDTVPVPLWYRKP